MAWKPNPAQAAALAALERGERALRRQPGANFGPEAFYALPGTIITHFRVGRDGRNALVHRVINGKDEMFRVWLDGKVDQI